jgi:CheY-like chemotaxis protein
LKPDDSNPPPAPVRNPGPGATNVILLVEDSPDDVFLFLDLIRANRIRNVIMQVHDGDEAITYLKGEDKFADRNAFPMPSVLFLDLRMPKVNGFEVLRWIKTQPQLKELLIIILTHHHEVRNVNEAYTLGAHSFLIKPLSPRELTNLITHFQPYFHHGSPPAS